jgi:hypothetical protein
MGCRKVFSLCLVVLLMGCAEPPHVGVTVSNTPDSIESCGPRSGACK